MVTPAGNFRRFFASQAFSLLANSMLQVSIAWLVYRTSQSPTLLGMIGFVGGLSAALFALLAGVWADRTDPRRILLGIQASMITTATVLAFLSTIGAVNVATIFVLASVATFGNSIAIPSRQLVLAAMTDGSGDLPKAVATNSIVYDCVRVAGPVLAGTMLSVFAAAQAFLISALCQAMAMILLSSLRPQRALGAPRQESFAAAFAEGVCFAIDCRPVLFILLLSGCGSVASSAYMVLMPVVAATVFGDGPHILGFLLAAVSVGGIGGGLFLRLRRGTGNLPALTGGGALVFAMALLFFSMSGWLPLSVLALVVAGFGVSIMMASAGTILLTIAPGRLRGRVISLFTLSFIGLAPLGSLGAGFLASRISALETISIAAAICLLAALALFSQAAVLGRMLAPH
jgi:MFS family permease